MPTAKTTKDLKAVDENQRRVFCREGHRIAWTATPVAEYERGGPWASDPVEHADGLCSAADTWRMKWVGSRKTGHYQLDHLGNARWTRTGHFKITRVATWATAAHVAGDEQIVSFNCSHNHYPAGGNIAISRDKSREAYLESLPREIREATDAASMTAAIQELTTQGWDWITDNRIRCRKCRAEEAELEARLRELAEADKA